MSSRGFTTGNHVADGSFATDHEVDGSPAERAPYFADRFFFQFVVLHK